MENENHIIFYDGDCGFCNKSVQFVLKFEKNKKIRFSALQSQFSKEFFRRHGFNDPDLSTFYFFKNGTLHERSTAALKVLLQLKWFMQPLNLGWLIPRFLRDKLYDFVANRRQKLATGFCLIPNIEDRSRFLN
jgi:predicted DCC family thiol-disulfide oxidoreductase YuxK